MKVPPKRKGNPGRAAPTRYQPSPLNESPSEKEGKSPKVIAKRAA